MEILIKYKKEISILVFFFVAVFISLFPFYLSKNKFSNPLGRNFTLEEKYASIQNIEGLLRESNISAINKTNLLIKKASILSIPRSIEEEETVIRETTKIYNNIILSEKENSFFRDAAFVGYMKLFTQHGFSPQFVSLFPRNLIEPYFSYIKKGYGDQLSSMLMFDEIGKMVFEKKDTSFLVYDIINKSVSLRSFHREPKSSLETSILKELGNDLNSIGNSRQIFSTSYGDVVLMRLLAETIGYDIYNSYSLQTISKEVSTLIDSKYDEALVKLNNDASIDKISIENVRIFVSMWYLDSLARRYGPMSYKEKEGELIKSILVDINASKEMKNLFSVYFNELVYGENKSYDRFKWKEPVNTHFVSLAKTNENLMSYFNSIGIKKEDIK